MRLEELYSLHTDTSQLFGSDVYPYKKFMEHLPLRKETLEETGEIMNSELKDMIKIMPHRDKRVEIFILTPDNYSSDLVISYAGFVMKKRWPLGEKAIIKDGDARTARHYAMMFNFRFTEAEPMIMQYPENAYYYAQDTLEGRWPEAEPYIRKNENVWLDYKDLWEPDGVSWE